MDINRFSSVFDKASIYTDISNSTGSVHPVVQTVADGKVDVAVVEVAFNHDRGQLVDYRLEKHLQIEQRPLQTC